MFLIALCVSIFLDAIQRFVEPQEVSNPKLVFIVGCFGLLSNIVGLVLFHDHSHGHGGDHSHEEIEPAEPVDAAEQGYTTDFGRNTAVVSDQGGTVASVMPHNALDACSRNLASRQRRKSSVGQSLNGRRYSGSAPRGFRDAEDFLVHPASLRQDIIEASRFDNAEDDAEDTDGPSEHSRLLPRSKASGSYSAVPEPNGSPPRKKSSKDLHLAHNHAQPKNADGNGGHSHSDLNMKGVFLHVVGDALGNIGVIASALIIWLTDYTWRFYVDPGISLVITIIILCSAIPLCKAASRILLQAVPPGMSIDHISEDIEQLPGVISCHHLHVWQLSNTKLVASLHIQVSYDIKGEGSDRYMELARHVRSCLHAYGIHSSTIQPEFQPGSDDDESGSDHTKTPNTQNQTSEANSLIRGQDSNACLLECGDECASGRQCCPSTTTGSS